MKTFCPLRMGNKDLVDKFIEEYCNKFSPKREPIDMFIMRYELDMSISEFYEYCKNFCSKNNAGDFLISYEVNENDLFILSSIGNCRIYDQYNNAEIKMCSGIFKDEKFLKIEEIKELITVGTFEMYLQEKYDLSFVLDVS